MFKITSKLPRREVEGTVFTFEPTEMDVKEGSAILTDPYLIVEEVGASAKKPENSNVSGLDLLKEKYAKLANKNSKEGVSLRKQIKELEAQAA